MIQEHWKNCSYFREVDNHGKIVTVKVTDSNGVVEQEWNGLPAGAGAGLENGGGTGSNL